MKEETGGLEKYRCIRAAVGIIVCPKLLSINLFPLYDE